MSNSSSDSSFDIEELLQIGSRCRELKKEKDMLKESQSQSFGLIRSLDVHMKSLSEFHTEDKKQIQMLEKELKNCSQEIDYLQDQLNARDTEVNLLQEHVHSLELKLADMETLQVTVDRLRDELKKSYSECLFLMQELENKEVELQNSNLFIEKLEESVSSISLESQCEIESMKLDMLALEQSFLEAKKIQEETVQEKTRMNELIQELEVQCQDAQKTTDDLYIENKELREKLDTSETNTRIFCQRIEKWLENDRYESKLESLLNEQDEKCTFSTDMSTCGEVLEPLFSKLAKVLAPDANFIVKMKEMSHQIHEYELLVKQLKEELREEKLKAKEEAEDLAQEMAELRYQLTGLLEEECKRRAYIEQASLQRISELEAQVHKARTKSSTCLLSLDE
ncbi:PREDICTED: sarcolemmal membrane-associated protein-like [Fragaria vesca subsp. vesca]|uniref:sarcolemmal membrane-associated protein-like n=1 Tax=Fragaria vesca subsp. vesca TaxID=101020 RepID=UPI0002C359F8|nr:PREDICTED: sarcolemmal membrane-associated protein-like [Fragaria vesca subsp. vesca]XP_011464333.1 PREDICTED: sarcolemmal membrane-associated protein-like [Fragaria vesca subsp. vesca]